MTKEQDRADELAAAKAAATAKDTALVTEGMRASGVNAEDVFNREGAWAQQAEGLLPDLREREEIQRELEAMSPEERAEAEKELADDPLAKEPGQGWGCRGRATSTSSSRATTTTAPTRTCMC